MPASNAPTLSPEQVRFDSPLLTDLSLIADRAETDTLLHFATGIDDDVGRLRPAWREAGRQILDDGLWGAGSTALRRFYRIIITHGDAGERVVVLRWKGAS